MDITGVMNQKSDSGGKSIILGVSRLSMRHDCLIDIGLVVSVFLGHPFFYGSNSFSDIVSVTDEFWEISDCGTCIIKIRLIDEMPS